MASARKGHRKLLLAWSNYWFLMVWISMNGYAFYNTYAFYKGREEYHYLRSILGSGLCISRGSATVLNINCCLVLLPMCRAVNSIVCRIVNRFCSKTILLFWLQNNKNFHVIVATTIASSSLVHTVSHIQNAINFSKHYDHLHSSINWANHKDENPFKMVASSLVGMTGMVMMIIVIVLTVSSCSIVRRRSYNVFWYIHNLCFLFLLLFLIHPFSGVLKEQTNVTSHVPGCLANHTCQEEAHFRPIETQGWLWVLVPTSVYIADLAFRVVRRNGGVTCVTASRKLGDGVLLTLPVPYPGFAPRPGQFVLLLCPAVSRSEWHPFTVIKCPTSSQPSLQVLVRARGDWSRKLQSLQYNCDTFLHEWPPKKRIRMYIDGPYNSPMEEIIKSRIALCVAAGVGITPFMSSISHLLTYDTQMPRTLHLVWIVRNMVQMKWSAQLLLAFHNKCWQNNEPDRFSFSIYLTSKADVAKYLHGQDQILLNRMHIGRPNWKRLFRQWQDMHGSQTCHVFTCGPKTLTNQVMKMCHGFCNFRFVRESFS